MKYNRVLIKISGEALGDNNENIAYKNILFFANEIKKVVDKKNKVGIVIGGGNIYRGNFVEKTNIQQIDGDYMGMLATMINSIAFKKVLENIGIKVKVLSSIEINKLFELCNHDKMQEYLDQNYVIILAGGTGNPCFTTDTTAALRAIEMKADVLLKATKVDGIYDSDPMKNKNAIKYNQITYQEAIEKNLKVMDLTAFAMCMENKVPIIVCNIFQENSILKILEGESLGTIVV